MLPVQIIAATPWVEATGRRFQTLVGKPIELVFGSKDLLARPADIALWRRHFPNAGVQMVENANHYTQEDCPENYVVAINNIARRLAGAD